MEDVKDQKGQGVQKVTSMDEVTKDNEREWDKEVLSGNAII